MRETEYAYAIARIRANELKMLGAQDLERLISAESYDAAVRILTDKGWAQPDANSAYDICEAELESAWQFISESVPDRSLLEAVIIGNDFANLKAAIKAKFSNHPLEDYMTVPCACPVEKIIKAVDEGEFADLPDYLKDCAYEAYHAYTEKQSGQLTEIIIDKACAAYKLTCADKAQSSLLKEIHTLTAAVSDIKTARRCVSTGKTKQFALDAVSGSGKLDVSALVNAAYDNKGLAEAVKASGLEELAEYADGDFTLLEMYCDNLITKKAKEYKHEVFGPDAAVAYYYGKLAEIKNVRIILSAKASGVPDSVISQRVRELYV